MINVINPFGHSFKGLASYLLRGPDNDNPERVDWVLTHNVGTDDPEIAWRIMVDTAKRAGELKKAAGFGAGGRKSKGPVMHYVLSWKPEEAETLTQEEMQRAALDSLKVLGKKRSKSRSAKTQTGYEHQAMIVAHKDKGHCHVHVMLSRTHPEHGLSLPSYNDQIRLSDWAHELRKAQGLEHLTPERVKNYEARKRSRRRPVPGVRVKGKPRIPRHIYELRQQAVNDNRLCERADSIHKRRDHRLTKLARGVERSQTEDRRSLDAAYIERAKEIKMSAVDAIEKENVRIHGEYDRKWEALMRDHEAEIRQHQAREQTWIGRKRNAIKSLGSIDFQSLMKSHERRRVLSDVFSVFTKTGAGLEILKRKLEKQAADLARRQRREEGVAKARIISVRSKRLSKSRVRYMQDRAAMLDRQQEQCARLERLWTMQRKARVSAFTKIRNHVQKTDLPRDEAVRVSDRFNLASSPEQSEDAASGESADPVRTLAEQLRKQREQQSRSRKRKPRHE